MVKKDFPAVRLLINDKNIGFPKAVNRGVKQSSGRYIALINSDVLVSVSSLCRLVSYLDDNPRVGADGPQLLEPDGHFQFSGGMAPSLTLALKSLFSSERGLMVRSRQQVGPIEVDWLSMASMVIRRQAMEEIGLLDESHFMYAEDMDYGLRLKKAGWRIALLSDIRVIHLFRASSSKNKLAETLGVAAFFRIAANELTSADYAIFGLLRSLAYALRFIVLKIGCLASKGACEKAPHLSLYTKIAFKLSLRNREYADRFCRDLENRLRQDDSQD